MSELAIRSEIAGDHVAAPERQRLADLEAVVERGLRTIGRGVVEVGTALRELRDSRVYRETHTTWDAYCRERWAIGGNYANKIIRAAAAADETGTTVPTTERAMRALLPGGSKKPHRDDASARALHALRGAPSFTTCAVTSRPTVTPPSERVRKLREKGIFDISLIVERARWAMVNVRGYLEEGATRTLPQLCSGLSADERGILEERELIRDRLQEWREHLDEIEKLVAEVGEDSA